MRSYTSSELPGRCKRCWVRASHCICGDVPSVDSRTEVLVVRHLRESWKSTGTARIAALALPRLRCVEYGDDAQPALGALDEACLEGAALLFPAEPTASWEAVAVKRLIVLDGTWRQTRRMFRRLVPLAALPRLALSASAEPAVRLRTTSFEGGRSTLEAIAEALGRLEGAHVAAPLHALHQRYVERVLRARGTWQDGAEAVV